MRGLKVGMISGASMVGVGGGGGGEEGGGEAVWLELDEREEDERAFSVG